MDVLAKTVAFLRNLPSFCHLPHEDQRRLLEGCWGPLFLLGLAQDTVTFEVAEAPVPSILKMILLEEPSSGARGVQPPERPQPSLAAVQWLRRCLESFWSLELGPTEYAYLKGTILFNPGELPDTPGWWPRWEGTGAIPGKGLSWGLTAIVSLGPRWPQIDSSQERRREKQLSEGHIARRRQRRAGSAGQATLFAAVPGKLGLNLRECGRAEGVGVDTAARQPYLQGQATQSGSKG